MEEPAPPTKATAAKSAEEAHPLTKATAAKSAEEPAPPTKATAAKSAAAPPKHPKSHQFQSEITGDDDDLYVDVHDEEALVVKKRAELEAHLAQYKMMSYTQLFTSRDTCLGHR